MIAPGVAAVQLVIGVRFNIVLLDYAASYGVLHCTVLANAMPSFHLETSEALFWF